MKNKTIDLGRFKKFNRFYVYYSLKLNQYISVLYLAIITTNKIRT